MVTLLGLFRQLSYVNLLEMVFEAGSNLGLWKGAPPCSSALTHATITVARTILMFLPPTAPGQVLRRRNRV